MTHTAVQIQQALDQLPRLQLNELPTPLHFCARLTEQLGGPRIFIKRDDLTGLAFGGNKSRYLEFTLAEAVEQGADAVVLSAVIQSNHCRQFAAACARVGLKGVVVLYQDENTPMGQRHRITGNYLLDQLFGADIRIAPASEISAVIDQEMECLRQQGYQPFTGLSGLRSRAAYIQCGLELASQCGALDFAARHIFSCSGGNSLAGLVAAFALLGQQPRFVGVPHNPLQSSPRQAAAQLAARAREAAEFIGLSCAPAPERLCVTTDCADPTFGLLDPPTREAINLLARSEGILLDPAYTGKAFATLLAHLRQGRLPADEDVVFVHTGGTPLTFVYGEDLLPDAEK